MRGTESTYLKNDSSVEQISFQQVSTHGGYNAKEMEALAKFKLYLDPPKPRMKKLSKARQFLRAQQTMQVNF